MGSTPEIETLRPKRVQREQLIRDARAARKTPKPCVRGEPEIEGSISEIESPILEIETLKLHVRSEPRIPA